MKNLTRKTDDCQIIRIGECKNKIHKNFFCNLELFWKVSHSNQWPTDQGPLYVEIQASNVKKDIFIILTYCGGQNDKS